MPSTSEIFQIIYISAATAPFAPKELATLLLKARANNLQLGVSGLLIHHTGSFFQVLEGQQAKVNSLYDRIAQDKRHERVLALSRGVVEQASFGDWSMGFVESTQGELNRLPGFNDFFRRGFQLTDPNLGASRAKELALAFRDGRFRQFVEGR